MARSTVGKIAYDLMLKDPESRDPIELQREMQKEYIKELMYCAQTHKKIFDADFYIVVITKNEKLMPNVFRNYFYARLTCPTPDYDQSVFIYNRELDIIKYVWTIPCKDACIYLINNSSRVDAQEQDLLSFVTDFANGTLYKKAKKLNGELEDTNIDTSSSLVIN